MANSSHFYKITIILVTGLILIGVFVVYEFLGAEKVDTERWSGNFEVYNSEKYGFSIEYPSVFKAFESPAGDVVSFGNPPEEPFRISIFVTSTALSSLEEWLRENPHLRLERRINPSGFEGLVTHYISNEGDVVEDKTTIIIKDGKLFRIETSYTAHDRILNSFKFE